MGLIRMTAAKGLEGNNEYNLVFNSLESAQMSLIIKKTWRLTRFFRRNRELLQFSRQKIFSAHL